ncbi:MAG: DUF4382 domain-containing protein [Ferruginibacter sp.]
MKKLTGIVLALMLVITSSLFFYSCKKDSVTSEQIPSGMNKFSVYLADDPADYEQVLIDIQSVAVKVDTCSHDNGDDDHHHPGCDDHHDSLSTHCEVWDTLNINPGIYDLLTLRNGVDTLLASGFLLNGRIERIKITLGNNNSVVVDSVNYPLHLVNNWNFIFINISREHIDSLSSNNLQLYLDFDVQRSIFHFNGAYWLSPVLRPFGHHSSGSIEGKISPLHSYGTITAYNATDTAYAIPWWQGEFKIRGLHEGTYSVLIDGINGFNDTTINDVEVRRRHETHLGVIQLNQ